MSATALDTAATSLHNWANYLRAEAEESRRANSSLAASGAMGAGVREALRALSAELSRWLGTRQQVEQVHHIVQTSSTLHRQIEAWAAAARLDPGLRMMVDPTLAGLGEALDFACAQAILHVCALPTTPGGLGARAELSVEAIHQSILLEYPELEALARQFPEARFLDAASAGAPSTPTHTAADRIVVAFGDIDSADSITTVVAGVGSSEPASWPTQLARAQLSAPPGQAAVAWLGYHAPSTLPEGTRKDPARHAGTALQVFQRDLAARNPRARKVVVGYSYGTMVADQAARGGLIVDDLVLVGSPGVASRSIRDLHLIGAGRVHAVTSAGDPIGYLSGINNPVSRLFGARVWPVPLMQHSEYWNSPEFLAALHGIAGGAAPT